MTAAAARPAPSEWLLLLAAALLGFFSQLASLPLFDQDEGAFSEATVEMLRSGDFLSPTLNGAPRYDKPILVYWAQAPIVALAGAQAWAFRLPSALAATLWMFATWAFVRARAPAASALCAAFAVAFSLMPSIVGHAAIADALLNLWLALACFDFWRFVESGRAAPLRRGYAWVGLGLLTKGPVAALIPALGVVLHLLGERQWQRLRRFVFAADGWLVAAAIPLVWLVPLCWRDHGVFLHHFLFDHNLARYTSTLQGHGGKPWYYVLWLPLVLLPYTGIVVRAAPLHWARVPALERYLWTWLAVAFAFFSCSATQLPHYILYGCAGVFVLAGLHAPAVENRWLPLLPAMALLAVLAALPWILPQVPPPEHHPFAAGVLARAQAGLGLHYRLVSAGACGLLVLLLAWRPLPAWQAVSIAGALQVAVVAFAVAPVLGDAQQAPVVEAARLARTHAGPVVSYETFLPSFSVYRGAATPNRLPAPGDWVFVNLDHLAGLEAALGPGALTPVFREGGVGLFARGPAP